jgi:hypothetical protein
VSCTSARICIAVGALTGRFTGRTLAERHS